MRTSILWVLVAVTACDAGKPTCKDAVVKARASVELGDSAAEALIGACELKDWSTTMRTCVATAKDADAIYACTNRDRYAETSVRLSEFADRMCECRDSACGQRVSDDMTRWGQDEARRNPRPPKFTDQQNKDFTAVGERLGKCMQQAMSQPAPQPQVIEDR